MLWRLFESSFHSFDVQTPKQSRHYRPEWTANTTMSPSDGDPKKQLTLWVKTKLANDAKGVI